MSNFGNMDLQADIRWLKDEIDKIKDPSIIEVLKKLLTYEKKASHISIAQYNKEIEEAEQQIEEGNFYTQEQVEKISADWQNRK